MYKELKLLQVSKVCSLETGKFEFKRNKNLLPTQIGRYFEDSSTQEITHSHNLRSRNSNAPPRFISEKFTGEKSIQYKGAQIWNSLPTEIKSSESLSTKISKACGALTKLRNCVKIDVLKNVYHALLHSYIRYGIVIWGHAAPAVLNPLQTLMNRAIRIMTYAPFGNIDLNPVYKELKL